MIDIQIAIFTTLVAAFVGSYLTFLTFKRQSLWHEKYQAYKEIISAVEDVLRIKGSGIKGSGSLNS